MQSHLGYIPVATGPLAKECRILTVDNRGHGDSDKPDDVNAYNNGDLLADDVAGAVSLTNGKPPVLVGWSIGGVIVGDYLAKYGDGAIAGLVYLGAGFVLGEGMHRFLHEDFARVVGDASSPHLPTSISGAVAVDRYCTYAPLTPEDFTVMVAASMAVPVEARIGLLAREYVDHILNTHPSVSVPARFLHGLEEQVVLPVSGEEGAAAMPNSKYVPLEKIGHSPSLECPDEVALAIREVMAESQS